MKNFLWAVFIAHIISYIWVEKKSYLFCDMFWNADSRVPSSKFLQFSFSGTVFLNGTHIASFITTAWLGLY